MQSRLGVWTVAVASALTCVVRLATDLYHYRYMISHGGDRALFDAVPYQVVRILEVGCAAAMVGGLVLCARGAVTRWGRLLLGFAAIAGCGRLFLALTTLMAQSLEDPAYRVSSLVALLGIPAFTGGAIALGASRRLAWTLIGLSAFSVCGALFGPVHATALHFALLALLSFHLLGAFPELVHVPHVSVSRAERRVRRLVVIVGAAFLIGGVLVAWAAFEVTRALSVGESGIIGICCAFAGGVALWRLQRPVSLPIVVVIAVGVAGAAQTLERLAVHSIAETPLETRAYPRFELALPAGVQTSRAYADLGAASINPNHAQLEAVTVSWGFRYPLSFEKPLTTNTIEVNGLAVDTLIYSSADDRGYLAYLAFTCSGVGVVVTISNLARTNLSLIELARRVARTVRCTPVDPTYARVHLPVALPRGFVERAGVHDQRQAYDGPAGQRFVVDWTIEVDLVGSLVDSPGELFRRFGVETLTDIERGVASGDREYMEMIVDDRRVLVAAWQCADVVVAAGYEGPATQSRDTALALVGATSCPTATRY